MLAWSLLLALQQLQGFKIKQRGTIFITRLADTEVPFSKEYLFHNSQMWWTSVPFANSPPSFVRQSPGHLYFKSFEDSVVQISVPRDKGVDEIPFLYFEKEAKHFLKT